MSYGQPCSRTTGGPPAGPASAYPTLRTPASICFTGPKTLGDSFTPSFAATNVMSAVPRIGDGPGSSEREREGFNARIKKLDLELPIHDRPRLPDQLIQSLFGDHALALLFDITAVRRARRLPVEADAESHRSPARCGSHDQMNVA